MDDEQASYRTDGATNVVVAKSQRSYCCSLIIGLVLLPVILIGGLIVWMLGPWPNTGEVLIVAKHVDNQNLTVVCTQEFTGTAEPYVVSLWFKKPGDQWRWLYVDHEDIYWWSGEIRMRPGKQSFDVFRGDRIVVSVDMKSKKYILNGDTRNFRVDDRGDATDALIRKPPRIVLAAAGD